MLNPIDSDRAPDPPDQRQYAPATQRNRDPILVVLQRVLPPTGTILEISSGTGEHAVYFAPRLSPRQWLPSDPNPIARHSIESWRWHEPAENLCAPLAIDVCDPLWAENIAPQVNPQFNLQSNLIQAIVNINMIHIAPWAACLGLMAGAARILPTGGVLYLYGPYQQQGQHTAESNAAFDASLRQQNSDWGVRELEAVVEVAEKQGLQWQETIAMPANNLSVVFCRL
ncbi:MAG: class I SAM-dependent methyltransferase [Elainella sp. Prado103]|jgi:hypothetical protein|nr:class I SAM-dependent methyltransferase [Elainella sp. Prado103]